MQLSKSSICIYTLTALFAFSLLTSSVYAQERSPQTTTPPKTIRVDFDNVPLPTFTKLMARTFKRTILLDERLDSKTITVFAPNPVSLPEAWQLYTTALKMHGFHIVKRGQIYSIHPAQPASSQSSPRRNRRPLSNDQLRIF